MLSRRCDKAEHRQLLALDVSALVGHPVTGIQRVIWELVPRLCRIGFQRGHGIALVDSLGWRPRVLVRWDRPVGDLVIREALEAIADDSRMRRVKAFLRTIGWALGAAGARGMLRRHSSARIFLEQVRAFLTGSLRLLGPALKQTDYYLAFSAGVLPTLVPRIADPDRVVLVLHDLIPIHYSHFISPEVSAAFAYNLTRLASTQQACRLVTACPHVAADIQELFWSLARRSVPVRVVSWGYARDKFFSEPDPEFRDLVGVPPGSRLVLAVSTQDPRKRFADIEAAVQQLDPDWQVHGVFIGKGPNQSSVGDRIHYLGHMPDQVLRRAYSSCDVFVNWSAAEGFGLPVIEALACGASVIIPPDNPTLRAVGGRHVRVASEATPQGLARAIGAALFSASGARLPANLDRYNWDQCCQHLADELWGEREAVLLPWPGRRAA